ncbi:MAG: glycoside hydrolase family 28 protein [Phycisphaerae bacterium]|jgi:polygalacturonase
MSRVFNVVDYGAIGDGKTSCTKAIAEAIEACSAAKGGQVLIPSGAYVTGPIVLKSNVQLHTESGTLVSFSRDRTDYPIVVHPDIGYDKARCMAPLYARGAANISITGNGVFDGNGEVWRPVKRAKVGEARWKELVAGGGVTDEKSSQWWPTPVARDCIETVRELADSGCADPQAFEKYRDAMRPCLMELIDCRNVLLEGPTFQNSPMWNLHPLLCENVTLRNIRVINPWWSQNGDGLDLDSCRNCLVTGCHFDVGDDAICIKSGKDEAGRALGRPTENVTITDCVVVHGHGGVVLGSETSGGMRNIHVSNCIFRGTDMGLRFKTARGRGGIVENVHINNITMTDILKDAITFSMFYEEAPAEPVSERTPQFRNFDITNVTCRGARSAITLRGLPEMPIENIRIQNASFVAETGVTIIDGKDISLAGVQVEARTGHALKCDNVTNLQLDRFVGKTK